ncbi:hypothetical protein BDR26DRAFT_994756 [Obelidium mucronatum]|nr:hypothetical protein BDR26DRAFT_994756 [Obelidium mucronatum]
MLDHQVFSEILLLQILMQHTECKSRKISCYQCHKKLQGMDKKSVNQHLQTECTQEIICPKNPNHQYQKKDELAHFQFFHPYFEKQTPSLAHVRNPSQFTQGNQIERFTPTEMAAMFGRSKDLRLLSLARFANEQVVQTDQSAVLACKYCKQPSFSSMKHLVLHWGKDCPQFMVRCDSRTRRKYQCGNDFQFKKSCLCNKQVLLKDFRKHFLYDCDDAVIECKDCSSNQPTTIPLHEYNSHWYENHYAKQSCLNCGKCFEDEMELTSHLLYECQDFTCTNDGCMVHLKHYSDFLKHLQVCQKVVTCHKCNGTYPVGRAFKDHYITTHILNVCGTCGREKKDNHKCFKDEEFTIHLADDVNYGCMGGIPSEDERHIPIKFMAEPENEIQFKFPGFYNYKVIDESGKSKTRKNATPRNLDVYQMNPGSVCGLFPKHDILHNFAIFPVGSFDTEKKTINAVFLFESTQCFLYVNDKTLTDGGEELKKRRTLNSESIIFTLKFVTEN